MDPRRLGRVACPLNHQKWKKKIQIPVGWTASQ